MKLAMQAKRLDDMVVLARDLVGANRSRLASAAPGLQPIAVHRHGFMAKYTALLPLCSKHGWHRCMLM